jgi:erythronate-4-phosphate dehydrogenase
MGMRVLLNDPPRERAEKSGAFASLSTIARECNIISFHVPLNVGGQDNTFHLADAAFFASLKQRPIVFNTARGEVFDTDALKKAQLTQQISGIVLDCWEHEPNIDTELLSMCDIGTPHIAGYSADGKANATMVCVRFVSHCLHLGLDDWCVTEIPKSVQPVIDLSANSQSTKEALASAILHSYNIEADSIKLKKSPDQFESFRNNYTIRREFPAFTVQIAKENSELINKLEALGFEVERLIL